MSFKQIQIDKFRCTGKEFRYTVNFTAINDQTLAHEYHSFKCDDPPRPSVMQHLAKVQALFLQFFGWQEFRVTADSIEFSRPEGKLKARLVLAMHSLGEDKDEGRLATPAISIEERTRVYKMDGKMVSEIVPDHPQTKLVDAVHNLCLAIE